MRCTRAPYIVVCTCTAANACAAECCSVTACSELFQFHRSGMRCLPTQGLGRRRSFISLGARPSDRAAYTWSHTRARRLRHEPLLRPQLLQPAVGGRSCAQRAGRSRQSGTKLDGRDQERARVDTDHWTGSSRGAATCRSAGNCPTSYSARAANMSDARKNTWACRWGASR